MKVDHHFLLMICVLFCAQIIQADVIHGLLGFGENNSNSDKSNNTPGESVSQSSSNPPSLPEPSHLVNNDNNNNNAPVSSTAPPSPVQSSSPTISPVQNSPPSPLSSPATPVSSNMDNSGPDADATPAQPNKTSPPTTKSPNSTTTESNKPNDTSPNKNHSSDGGNTNGNSKNNDSRGKNDNNESNSDSDVVNAKTDASNTPESSPQSNTGTIAGAVMSGIVGLALIGGFVTWCNRKGGCTKRQKHGVRDGNFNQNDDYSIDMYPHASSMPGIKNDTSATGIVGMTPVSPFDHSRQFGTVPAYTDTHYHNELQQQEYHGITSDGTGYYYNDPEHQHYYSPDIYKPNAVDDNHNYKPNAI